MPFTGTYLFSDVNDGHAPVRVGNVDRTKNLVHLENLNPAVSRQVKLDVGVHVDIYVELTFLSTLASANTAGPHAVPDR